MKMGHSLDTGIRLRLAVERNDCLADKRFEATHTGVVRPARSTASQLHWIPFPAAGASRADYFRDLAPLPVENTAVLAPAGARRPPIPPPSLPGPGPRQSRYSSALNEHPHSAPQFCCARLPLLAGTAQASAARLLRSGTHPCRGPRALAIRAGCQ